jgi:hypothetical protein
LFPWFRSRRIDRSFFSGSKAGNSNCCRRPQKRPWENPGRGAAGVVVKKGSLERPQEDHRRGRPQERPPRSGRQVRRRARTENSLGFNTARSSGRHR